MHISQTHYTSDAMICINILISPIIIAIVVFRKTGSEIQSPALNFMCSLIHTQFVFCRPYKVRKMLEEMGIGLFHDRTNIGLG